MATKKITSYKLLSLIRGEKDPLTAFRLFKNHNAGEPVKCTMLHYDVLISRLAGAKYSTVNEIEHLLPQVKANSLLIPGEILFCNLFKFYSRIGRPDSAINLFDEMPEYRCQRTIKSLNSLIDGLLKCKEYDDAKRLLLNVDKFGKPDACTYNILIKWTCKCGRLADALQLLKEMLDGEITPDLRTFKTLIRWLCLDLRVKEAFELKKFMTEKLNLQSNAALYESLMAGLCNSGKLDLAFELKDEMIRERIEVSSGIYSTLMSGLLKAGRGEEIDSMLEEMKAKGCKKSNVVFNVIIQRACIEAKFDLALKVLEDMKEEGFNPDVVSYNTILNNLCKKGKWSDAHELFEDMPRRGCAPDVVSYRIVLDGLLEAKRFQEGFLVLDEMIFKGFYPHSDTVEKFLCFVGQTNFDKLVSPLIVCLTKAKLLDEKRWRTVVSAVINDFMPSFEFFLLDFLVIS